MLYAVVMPVFNEAALFGAAFDRLLATAPVDGHDRLVVVVDDGSTDGTAREIAACCSVRGHHDGPSAPDAGTLPGVVTLSHATNLGKGAAVRTGLLAALERGADAVLIHDADLEYDPADHATLLAPLLDGRADVVIGSRFIGGTHRVLYYWHSIVNRGLTMLSNMLTNLNLTDIECCLKAFSRDAAMQLHIRERRFGVEPELIAKSSRLRFPIDGETNPHRTRAVRMYEVPVNYAGRTYAEGKKIGWKDGFDALRCIVRYNVTP